MGAMSRDEFEAFADEWQQAGGWQVPAHVVSDLIDRIHQLESDAWKRRAAAAAGTDREPQPTDGPDCHAEHLVRAVTEPQSEPEFTGSMWEAVEWTTESAVGDPGQRVVILLAPDV